VPQPATALRRVEHRPLPRGEVAVRRALDGRVRIAVPVAHLPQEHLDGFGVERDVVDGEPGDPVVVGQAQGRR
jgi:hypothetical protein